MNIATQMKVTVNTTYKVSYATEAELSAFMVGKTLAGAMAPLTAVTVSNLVKIAYREGHTKQMNGNVFIVSHNENPDLYSALIRC